MIEVPVVTAVVKELAGVIFGFAELVLEKAAVVAVTELELELGLELRELAVVVVTELELVLVKVVVVVVIERVEGQEMTLVEVEA